MSSYYLKVTHIPTKELIGMSVPEGEDGLGNLQNICTLFGKSKLQYLELETIDGRLTIPETVLKVCTILLEEVL
ncbi:hypothetical protein VPHK460_0105 [Vibrio phage K460]